MARTQIPKRTEPKQEVSHPVQPHNRPYTGPKGSANPQPPQAVSVQRMWDEYVYRMKNLPASAKAQFIRELPMGLQEMCYLIVEATGTETEQKYVLQYLQKPGRAARERFAPQMTTVIDSEPQEQELEEPAAVVV